MISLKAPFRLEISKDIVFLHRPKPLEEKDITAYIEEEISSLLSQEETFTDVLYRFAKTSKGLLIAVARKKNLARAGTSPTGLRIPAPIFGWGQFKKAVDIPSGAFAFFHFEHEDVHYLLAASGEGIERVLFFRGEERFFKSLIPALYKWKNDDPDLKEAKALYCFSPFPESVSNDLRNAGIEVKTVSAEGKDKQVSILSAGEKSTLLIWDFRLPEEIDAHALSLAKKKTLVLALLSVAVIAALWFAFFTGEKYFAYREGRLSREWRKVSGSLREIQFLRDQNLSAISEILLCEELSDRRSIAGLVMDRIARTRPDAVKLEQMKIGNFRMASDTKGQNPKVQVTLKGYSSDGTQITAWMEKLGQEKILSSVKLVGMDNKAEKYFFKIEMEADKKGQEKTRKKSS